ncbi:DUF2057 family protein [Thalassotalea maritima]|uniref:DUF2057 family protein n=1 Tax=Thalassotalea maritima TaxID=3242416 RepID=UPI00352757F0
MAVPSMATSVVIPSSFAVEQVNGEDIAYSFLAKQRKFPLRAGNNSLVLKYEALFEDEFEDHHHNVRSKPFIVQFALKGDEALVLQYAIPVDVSAARQFATAPQVVLIDRNNHQQAITSKIESLSSYQQRLAQLIKHDNGIIVTENTASKVNEYNDIAPETNNKQQNQEEYQTNNAPEVKSLSMLKYWWQRATQQEKQAFIDFINKD